MTVHVFMLIFPKVEFLHTTILIFNLEMWVRVLVLLSSVCLLREVVVDK